MTVGLAAVRIWGRGRGGSTDWWGLTGGGLPDMGQCKKERKEKKLKKIKYHMSHFGWYISPNISL